MRGGQQVVDGITVAAAAVITTAKAGWCQCRRRAAARQPAEAKHSTARQCLRQAQRQVAGARSKDEDGALAEHKFAAVHKKGPRRRTSSTSRRAALDKAPQ